VLMELRQLDPASPSAVAIANRQSKTAKDSRQND
jgi:hypothetical protein